MRIMRIAGSSSMSAATTLHVPRWPETRFTIEIRTNQNLWKFVPCKILGKD